MKEIEFILCAAILRKEPRDSDCNYYDNDIQNIELGYRHHDILIRFRGEVSTQQEDQGFYTSRGRFVDRKEAFEIAKSAGQIETDEDRGILFSEDLY